MNKVICGLLACLALAACGGGNDHTIVSPGSSTSTGSGSGSTTTTTLSLGSGTGANFQAGQIALGATSLSAGGSTSLTVTLVDQTGALYAQSATIAFTSGCLGAGTAQVTPSSVTTTNGTATVTYAAKGCSGADVITASTTANAQSLSAVGTVTVQSATLGSVIFQSASPATIGLKGTGIQETSTLVFNVVDSSNGPVANADVTFALSTNVGGITLSATTAKSGADGKVQTVVQAGTVHTSVRVTATATLNGITQSTQSSNLTVTTGIPDTDSFSVAPVCPNVEAFNVDGVQAVVTARLSDRYNNPVPDGTAVAFTAEGGKIGGQCATATTSSESGVCSVNWTSQNPRPSNGRITILATALGEDSFVDTNANGFFDTGETYSDLGEPYRDDDESGTFTAGESFLDFNGNGSRDATYGSFKGVLCSGSGASSTCSLSTTAIGAQTLIVMSTSGANITGPASITGTSAGQVIPLTYNIQDLNGNAMPKGTTIVVTANSAAGTLDTPSSFTVPCDAGRGGMDVTVYLTRPSPLTGSGSVTVTVTSPGGIISTYHTTIS